MPLHPRPRPPHAHDHRCPTDVRNLLSLDVVVVGPSAGSVLFWNFQKAKNRNNTAAADKVISSYWCRQRGTRAKRKPSTWPVASSFWCRPVELEVTRTPIKCAVRESAARMTFPHTIHTRILVISHSNNIFLRKCHSNGQTKCCLYSVVPGKVKLLKGLEKVVAAWPTELFQLSGKERERRRNHWWWDRGRWI